MTATRRLFWGLVILETVLVLIFAALGKEYLLLGMGTLVLLLLPLAGRLSIVWAILIISPVVYLEGIPLGIIRAGKWIFVILVVLLWLLSKAIQRKKIRLPEAKTRVLITAFLCWGAFISFHAIQPVISFAGLLKLVSIFGLFYLFSDMLRSRRDIRHTILIWIGIGGILSILGIYQYFNSWAHWGVGQRIWAAFENPNNLGIFLYLLIPITFSLLLQPGKIIPRIVLGLCLVLFLLCLYWTGSRAAWVATYVAFIALSIITRKKYLAGALFLFGAILGILLFRSLATGQLAALLRVGRGLSFRPILWGVSWRIFRHNPLFGVGFGCIPQVFQSYFPVSALSLRSYLFPLAGSPHNLFFQTGAETGLPGVAFILGFFIVFYRDARGFYHRATHPLDRAIAASFWATVIGLFAHAFFELSALIGPGSYTVFFWLLVALFYAVRRRREALTAGWIPA